MAVIEPHVFFGLDGITGKFDIIASTEIDGDYIEQKIPKPRSPLQNMLMTFDIVSWSLIGVSIILLSIITALIYNFHSPKTSVSC